MATIYTLTIQAAPQTLQALVQGGYTLYALQAVQGAGGGVPVAWLRTRAFSENTRLAWENTYQAYTSTSQSVPGGTITAIAAYPIAPGQTLQVTSPTGTGTVVSGGVAGEVSILNQTTVPFTAGLAQSMNGSGEPLCAFPLYGGNLVLVSPVPQVLVMFSAVPDQTVMTQALGPGVLVDFTGATDRSVTFDINNGWAWGEEAWGKAVPPLSDLVPLLIQPLGQVSGVQLMAGAPELAADAPPAVVDDAPPANGAEPVEPRPEVAAALLAEPLPD